MEYQLVRWQVAIINFELVMVQLMIIVLILVQLSEGQAYSVMAKAKFIASATNPEFVVLKQIIFVQYYH